MFVYSRRVLYRMIALEVHITSVPVVSHQYLSKLSLNSGKVSHVDSILTLYGTLATALVLLAVSE